MSEKNTKDEFEPEFDGQRHDESVLHVFRRHPIAMRKGFYALLIPFVLGSIPVFVWPTSLAMLWFPVIGLSLGLLLFFYHWIAWYFTVFVVTDQRLRQVTQKGLFGKNVVDLGISKIQNISYNVPGLSGELLGYGTIIIQTYVGDLILDKVHHPSKTYNKLQDAVKNASDNQKVDDEDIEI